MVTGCFPSCFGINTWLQNTWDAEACYVHICKEHWGLVLVCLGGWKALLLRQHLGEESREHSWLVRALAACHEEEEEKGPTEEGSRNKDQQRATEEGRKAPRVKRKSSHLFALLTPTRFGSLAVIMRIGWETILEDDDIYLPSQSLLLTLSASFLSSQK